MHWELVQQDIDYHIGIKLQYNDLMNLCEVNKRFGQLGNNIWFWKLKAMRDFAITSDNFEELNQETINFPTPGSAKIAEHETYIRLAGEHLMPIPGAERYGDILDLTTRAVINDEDLSLIRYFFEIKRSYRFLPILGKRNRF